MKSWPPFTGAVFGVLTLLTAPAQAERVDDLSVRQGQIIGIAASGRPIGTRELVGTDFVDGAFTYSIIDVSRDPLIDGLWRYRVVWRPAGSDAPTSYCPNRSDSSGWAFALPSASGGGVRFVCEDLAMARCLAAAKPADAEAAITACVDRSEN